jgi:hypothetical protein
MTVRSDTLDVRPHASLRSRRFALAFATAMLAVNLIGFGPTLYLRAFFDAPPLPLYLYLHGALGTAWFLLMVVQTGLVANRRVAVHRRLGWVAVAIAVAVLITGLYTSTNMVPRNAALGLTSEADLRLYGLVTAADIAGSIVFATLVLLGAAFRRRADVHKRLMLIAAFSILGPAAARIASWFGELPNLLIPAISVCFVAALVVHDVRERSRPHVATVLALLLHFGLNLVMQLSGIGPALVAERLGQ